MSDEPAPEPKMPDVSKRPAPMPPPITDNDWRPKTGPQVEPPPRPQPKEQPRGSLI